ncbi:MAG: hypothetical protein CMF48_01600 [Legionellales bacterium]|nr:hypothetical protein [Legionellales bacterium]
MAFPTNFDDYKTAVEGKSTDQILEIYPQAKETFNSAMGSATTVLSQPWEDDHEEALLKDFKTIIKNCLILHPSTRHADKVYALIEQLPNLNTLETFFITFKKEFLDLVVTKGWGSGSGLYKALATEHGFIPLLTQALEQHAQHQENIFKAQFGALEELNKASDTFKDAQDVNDFLKSASNIIRYALNDKVPTKNLTDCIAQWEQSMLKTITSPAALKVELDALIATAAKGDSYTAASEYSSRLKSLIPVLEEACERFVQYAATFASSAVSDAAILNTEAALQEAESLKASLLAARREGEALKHKNDELTQRNNALSAELEAATTQAAEMKDSLKSLPNVPSLSPEPTTTESDIAAVTGWMTELAQQLAEERAKSAASLEAQEANTARLRALDAFLAGDFDAIDDESLEEYATAFSAAKERAESATAQLGKQDRQIRFLLGDNVVLVESDQASETILQSAQQELRELRAFKDKYQSDRDAATKLRLDLARAEGEKASLSRRLEALIAKSGALTTVESRLSDAKRELEAAQDLNLTVGRQAGILHGLNVRTAMLAQQRVSDEQQGDAAYTATATKPKRV